MKRILLFVVVLSCYALCVNAQTRTVRGNYCGSDTGNRAGNFGFWVQGNVMRFDMNFGQVHGNAKMTRFNVNKLHVGDEFIINYRPEQEYDSVGFILSIAGTGKRKKVHACSYE